MDGEHTARLDHRAQYGFARTHGVGEIPGLLLENAESDIHVGVAGRLLAIRDQGSILFGDLSDESGEVQVVADSTRTPEFDAMQTLSIGDWVGVKGLVAATGRGQTSVFVDDWVRLARTVIPFPNKRQGLTDLDTVYRQRELDLAVNRESMTRFQKRSQIISETRRFLEAQDFIEVETPILQPLYGGAAAKPFETHHNALDMDMYLRISPELYLKRLVAGGLQRVFEMGKVFRNEGISPRHNPEFTMLETYAAYWDFEDQMRFTETLTEHLARMLHGTPQITYGDRAVDLSAPWPRASMDDLASEATGESVSINLGVDKLRELCREYDVPYEEGYGAGKLLLELYEKTAEPQIWGPMFVTDYPQEVSPLARAHRTKPGYTERFEGFVAGGEICNGYTELNDPRLQYEQFLAQEATSDAVAMRLDHDYVRALQIGLPPTAGLGIGIDRLVMLLTDAKSIKDVIFFPVQRADNFRVTTYQ